jgi:hypothetical protein
MNSENIKSDLESHPLGTTKKFNLKRYLLLDIQKVAFKGTSVKELVLNVSSQPLTKDFVLGYLKNENYPNNILPVELPDKPGQQAFFLSLFGNLKTWPSLNYHKEFLLLEPKELGLYHIVGVFKRMKDMVPFRTPEMKALIVIHKCRAKRFVCDEYKNKTVNEAELWDLTQELASTLQSTSKR